MEINVRRPDVKAIVKIDGEKIDAKYIHLQQEVGKHHDFEVLVEHLAFDPTFFSSSESKLSLVFTKIVITLQHGEEIDKAYTFAGIIDSVQIVARDGMHGGVLLKGKSSSVELERGAIMQSYSCTNLPAIAKIVTGGTILLKTEITTKLTGDIDFALQYKESDWDFLTRIVAQFREVVIYTGEYLYVGRHPEFPIVELTYDRELIAMEICSRLIPNQYTEYHYQREENETIKEDSPASIDNANGYLQKISKQSDFLNKSRKPNVPVEAWVPDMGSLQEQVKRRKIARGAEMMYIRGEAKTCDVKIGGLIQVKLPVTMGGTDLGQYRITVCTHNIDEAGHYKCMFEAIPADLEYIPMPEAPIPNPKNIQCKVWDNVDPKGIGRVKIDLPFDKKKCETWIPVMRPDAGSGIGKSRGLSALPELGDTSVLSFLDGSTLSQPVIIGSMFHGDNAEGLGGGSGNHIMSLRDKSGSEVILNDKEGSIDMYSKKGDTRYKADGKGNASLSTPDTITLTATNIILKASNSIKIESNPGDTEGVGKIDIFAEENIQMNSETASISLTSKNANITMASDKGKYGVSSNETTMSSKGNTTQSSGGVFKITGSSNVEINK